ncbi:site-specific DNA-methyltransferase [Candidatus Woesearchaeota archaeon]|nr:site-specific DNA-methyltransferase [Candidatus Woesearchaeota archaeon]
MLDKFMNKIVRGDCIQVLKEIPDNSVDLIFADPPYNLQLRGELWRPNQTKVDAVNDEWDKFNSFEDYDKFSQEWLKECLRVLKENGTIWVIGSYHNIFRIGKVMQDIGFWILNDVLWIKTNPMPNFKGTRFNNAHETLIWASKNKDSRYTFHYKTMKAFNDDLQLRSDWYIPICNGGERIRINGEKAHSTQKPEALLYRIIISTSNPNDIVLDPFMGSGTTGAVAKKLGRNFIGIEKEEYYIKIANERIANVKPYAHQTLAYPLEAKKPKVSFGNLIEAGLIKPGEKLFSKDKRHKAEVLTNATIVLNNISGSIHSVSAQALGKTSNNGWTFWFVERDNNLKSIDDLRKEYMEKYITL